MTMATITSKGQITVPKDIRASLMLHSGDKIDFTVTDRGEVLLRPLTRRVDDIFGRLHQPGREALSPEEMNAAIKRKLSERSG